MMRIKLIAAGAAIAWATTVGMASAADLTSIAGIQADPLTAAEMAQVRGKQDTIDFSLFIAISQPDGNIIEVDRFMAVGRVSEVADPEFAFVHFFVLDADPGEGPAVPEIIIGR